MLLAYTDFAKNNIFADFSNQDILKCNLLGEVIITISDLCNRHCWFCPRNNTYKSPHANLYISVELINKICNDLGPEYNGIISLSGFGEPLLHPHIKDIIIIITSICQKAKLIIHSNCDNWKAIDSLPYISNLQIIYSQYENNNQLIKHLDHLSNNVYLKSLEAHKKYFNNRGGNSKYQTDKILPLKQICNIPFYKTSVDINGDIILCCSDWQRTTFFGNLHEKSIFEVWNNTKYNDIRKSLLNNTRLGICTKCDVDGRFAGNNFVKLWKSKLH